MQAMVMSMNEHHVAGRQANHRVWQEAQSVAAVSHDSSVPSYSARSWRQDPSLSMRREHSAATREQSADSLSWKRQVANRVKASKKRKPE
jgi:hypothetical protein